MQLLLHRIGRLTRISSCYLSKKQLLKPLIQKNTLLSYTSLSSTTTIRFLQARYKSSSRPACGIIKLNIMNSVTSKEAFDFLSRFGVSKSNTDTLKTVYVCSDNSKIKVEFLYNVNGRYKTFNLLREENEKVAASLKRLELNLEKFFKLRYKKIKSEQNNTDIEITIKINGQKVTGEERNIDAWVEGAILEINGVDYHIVKNCPQVSDIHIPKTVLEGFPLIPKINLVNCELKDCKFFWYRLLTAAEKRAKNYDENNVIFSDDMYWFLVSKGLFYIPTQDDVGHHLILVFIPLNNESQGPIHYYKSNIVAEFSKDYPFLKRQTQTQQKPDNDKLRIVTYNLLADVYANSNYSRTHLFAHCDREFLDINYRRLLLVKEIEGYNADIICLQEVDRKEFNYTYSDYFEFRGYKCLFNQKPSTSEGLATLFNRDKYQLIHSHITKLSDLIDPDFVPTLDETKTEQPTTSPDDIEEMPMTDEECTEPVKIDHFILNDRNSSDAKNCLDIFSDIRQAIEANALLKERFCRRNSILQTTLIKLKEIDYLLLIANTHFFSAADADHIRLLQGAISLRYIDYLKNYYSKAKQFLGDTEPRVGVIFCGDWNSTIDSGIHQLLSEGFVSRNLDDWKSNPDQKVENLDLKNEFKMCSAYQDLEYSNYTPLFQGWLDHIYYDSENFKCESVIPPPSHEEVIRTKGMPSDVIPSDHFPLIANLSISSAS